MAKIVKYYSGVFHAQFETGKGKPVYAHMQTADISIHPRFVLEDAQEIDVQTYEAATLDPAQPYLQRKLSAPAELLERHKDARNVYLNEVTLSWADGAYQNQSVWTFIAEKDGKRHGRLKAQAFAAVVEDGPDAEPIIQPKPTPQKIDQPPSFTNPTPVPVGQGNGIDQPMPVSGENGLPTVQPIAPTRGCLSLGGIVPSGGLPTGCIKPGCALLAFIPLILLLLTLFRECSRDTSEKASENTTPTVVHDTVYVERIEERVDTLTLFKTDTIQLVDSTRETLFKPVVLPNVQFYTNSAKLIPTSLSDIQQLAQHLIDTPELTAMVIGHTDSIGNAQKNLQLSKMRAETVRNVIISMGVEQNRINAIGKGESEPKADNGTEEGRLMNRRVEVQLEQTSVEERKTIRKP